MSKLILDDLTIEKSTNGFNLEINESCDYGSTSAKTHITKEVAQKLIDFLIEVKQINQNEKSVLE